MMLREEFKIGYDSCLNSLATARPHPQHTACRRDAPGTTIKKTKNKAYTKTRRKRRTRGMGAKETRETRSRDDPTEETDSNEGWS